MYCEESGYILVEYGWLILGTLVVFLLVYKRFISSFIQDIQLRKELERRKKFDTEVQEAYGYHIQIARERAQQELDNKIVEAHKHLKVTKQKNQKGIMEKALSGTSKINADPYTFVTGLTSSTPVVIFSKTYCPYCKNAKQALSTFRMQGDLYKIIELDEREDCDKIQDVLLQITGARSVPRVFIGGKCIGGCDDTIAAQKDGRLEKMLKDVGATSSFLFYFVDLAILYFGNLIEASGDILLSIIC
uniref:Glutaredoxin domain-containing protein n=1 Tax=Elaeophora elaphi TaxID=1147741 RepID=A0A0R3S1R6_9BILA